MHLMKLLGHRNIKNILFSTQLIEPRNDKEYVSKVAKMIHEAKVLVKQALNRSATSMKLGYPENVNKKAPLAYAKLT